MLKVYAECEVQWNTKMQKSIIPIIKKHKRVTIYTSVLFLFIGAAYIGRTLGSDHHYRYRLKIALTIEGRPYTGTGVIEVQAIVGPKWLRTINYASEGLHARGEAIVVEFPPRQAIALALDTLDGNDPAYTPTYLLSGTKPKSIEDASTIVDRLESGHSSKDVLPKFLWRVVYFQNKNDPRTVERIAVQPNGDTTDVRIHVDSINIETTNSTVSTGITEQLPWLRDMKSGVKIGDETMMGGRPLYRENFKAGEE